MAIIFNTDISSNNLLLAYVNNVVRFRTSSTLAILKAEIFFASETKTLSPAPDGSFYFNFKDFITTLINVDNFKDDLNVNIADDGYLYDWTAKTFLSGNCVFKITFVGGTFEQTTKSLSWLSALMQLDTYKRRYPVMLGANKLLVLSPFAQATNRRAFVKYWQGYPFDITLHVPTTNDLTITNTVNLLDTVFENPTRISRLVFSDGDTNETLEDLLPMREGFNLLTFEQTVSEGVTSSYELLVEKITDGCGVYLKWLNELGGWNYWLFTAAGEQRTARDIGELANDFNNLPDTISPTVQRGRTSFDTCNLLAEQLTPDEVLLLEGIFDSAKVYLFTGEPFAKNNHNDWLEVSLKTTSLRTKQPKRTLNRFELQIDLPQRNTRTL